MRIFILIFLFLSPVELYSSNNPYKNNEVNNFIISMKNKHNYDEEKLRSLFNQIKPESRLTKFFKKAPERTLTWNGCLRKDRNCTNYKNLFVNESLANGGLRFWKENEKYLKQAYYRFGVPPEIIVAIIGIESKFGKKSAAAALAAER